MSDDEILLEVKKLVERAGQPYVLSALTGLGVSATTAERIVKGRYSRTPTGLLRRALLDVLESKAS